MPIYFTINHERRPTDYTTIKRIFDSLKSLSITPSLENTFYSFAKDAFDNNQSSSTVDDFLAIHLAILNNYSPSSNGLLLRGLLQFMQLISAAVHDSDFPNSHIKKWLNDVASYAKFKEKIAELEIILEPKSLFHTVEQSLPLTVVLAQQISMLNNKMEVMQLKIQALEAEHMKLITQSSPVAGSSQRGGIFFDRSSTKDNQKLSKTFGAQQLI